MRALPYAQTESGRLYLDVLESGSRLNQALAQEHEIDPPPSGDAGDAERWRAARNEVERAVEYYALALEKYRESVLSDLGPLIRSQQR